MKIPIDPIVHTFRPGTELRVIVSAPGGDRPVWTFDTVDDGQQATVGFGFGSPSALTVNVVQGVNATTALPSCGSLRGNPVGPTRPKATSREAGPSAGCRGQGRAPRVTTQHRAPSLRPISEIGVRPQTAQEDLRFLVMALPATSHVEVSIGFPGVKHSYSSP